MTEDFSITLPLVDISDEITEIPVIIRRGDGGLCIYMENEELPRCAIVISRGVMLVSIYPDDIWEDVTTYETHKAVDKGEA